MHKKVIAYYISHMHVWTCTFKYTRSETQT